MAEPVLTYSIFKAMGPAGSDSIVLVDLLLDVAYNGGSSRAMFTVDLPSPLMNASTLSDDDIIFAAKNEITAAKLEEIVNDAISVINRENKRAINTNIVREVVDPPQPITRISPRQARLELTNRGLLSNVDAVIAALPAEQKAVVEIEWEYAVYIERNSPWVIQLGTALGLDDSGLDDLFLKAAEL